MDATLTPEIAAWEDRLVAWHEANPSADPAHDLDHLRRVWANAQTIAAEEPGADPLVLVAACLLHDLVNVPKDHPDRAQASRRSADAAVVLLRDLDFPEDRLGAVAHAIAAHSFSAGVAPRTVEACIVQDADRLEGVGAIGIARCFAVSGQLGLRLAHPTDPLGRNRRLDDGAFALDHFGVKLLRLPETMRTAPGRRLAVARAAVLRAFQERLAAEMRGEA